MEQPPTSCVEAEEALSPSKAGTTGSSTLSNPETPPKIPRKKKKKHKKPKQKGELVLCSVVDEP